MPRPPTAAAPPRGAAGAPRARDRLRRSARALRRVRGRSVCGAAGQRGADDRGRHSLLAAEPFRVLTSKDGAIALDGERGRGRSVRRAARELGAPRAAAGARAAAVPGRRGRILRLRAGAASRAGAARRADDRDFPIWSCFYDVVVAFDHRERRAWIVSSGLPETEPARRRARARGALRHAGALAGVGALGAPPAAGPAPRIDSNFTRERLRGGRAAGDRLHPRRRHLPGQPVAALHAPTAAGADAVRSLSPAARASIRRRSRPTSSSTTSSSPRRRPSASCASTGDASRPARSRARGRAAPTPAEDARARRRAAGQREGPRRERDDRRPPAQRPVARLPRRHRRRARSSARSSASPPCIHLVSTVTGRAAPGHRRGRPAGGVLSRRLDHGRAEDPRDGDHRRARADAPRALLRQRSATSASTARMDTSIVIRTFARARTAA